ncbi:histidine phosphatase family protein [Nonomuraea sp. NPDC046570]|uniref:histidine phosphatase family protein n=1 Tax=Nonomuraea sp. NPDC046570 TaxID=3155255 RepID=UPI0033CCD609
MPASTSSRLCRIGGLRTCRGLTPEGRQQLAKLSQRLADRFASPSTSSTPRRCRAQPRSPGSSPTPSAWAPVVYPDLREPDCGSADGLPWEKAVADFGDAPTRVASNVMWMMWEPPLGRAAALVCSTAGSPQPSTSAASRSGTISS